MSNPQNEKLIEFINGTWPRTAWVVERQLEGLSHEDCLLQLPFRGNCANWVLGHIISSRSSMIWAATGENYWSDEQNNLYKFGSEPITDGENALPLAELKQHLKASGEQLAAAVSEATEEKLAAPWLEGREQSLLDFLLFMSWHEGYHVGQFEYLRQLAGKDDHII